MLNILLSIVCYDIWFYISHVLLHKRSFYRYHSEHHEYPIPTFLETYKGHWVEGPFQGIGLVVPYFFLPYSFVDIGICLFLVNLRGMMRHDERCIWLIGNHHLLHHRYPQYNFGEYWLDALCGTKYPNNAEYKKGLIYL